MADDIRAARESLQRIRQALRTEQDSEKVAGLERAKLSATKQLLQAQEAVELAAVIRAREQWREHLEELRATRERLKEFAAVG